MLQLKNSASFQVKLFGLTVNGCKKWQRKVLEPGESAQISTTVGYAWILSKGSDGSMLKNFAITKATQKIDVPADGKTTSTAKVSISTKKPASTIKTLLAKPMTTVKPAQTIAPTPSHIPPPPVQGPVIIGNSNTSGNPSRFVTGAPSTPPQQPPAVVAPAPQTTSTNVQPQNIEVGNQNEPVQSQQNPVVSTQETPTSTEPTPITPTNLNTASRTTQKSQILPSGAVAQSISSDAAPKSGPNVCVIIGSVFGVALFIGLSVFVYRRRKSSFDYKASRYQNYNKSAVSTSPFSIHLSPTVPEPAFITHETVLRDDNYPTNNMQFQGRNSIYSEMVQSRKSVPVTEHRETAARSFFANMFGMNKSDEKHYSTKAKSVASGWFRDDKTIAKRDSFFAISP